MHTSARTRRSARRALFTLLAAVALGVLGTSPAVAAVPGSVYTQTNDPAGNQVVVFTRAADGTLSETTRVATGGNGDGSTPPFGFEILDSQGGVDLSDSEHLVFAVNAGSDTLSSFRVLPGGGLALVGSVPTGDLPVSVDSHGDLVYVLNEGDLGASGPTAGTIQGYRAAANGQLTPIAGSVEPLSLTGNSNSAPAQIAFDATGRVLTVTHRFPVAPATSERIDTFVLGADGTPGPAIVNTATGAAPFGFAYDANGHAIVSNALDGSISSYQLNTTTGTLTPIDNEPTTQGAPCWVVITPDNRFAFVANTGSNTITRLQIAADGTLTELGQTPVPSTGGAAADAALTPDGRFLTVLVPTLAGPDTSQTDTYAVGADGSLTLLNPGGTTPANLPAGVSGLAASGADATPPDTAITSGPATGSTTNDNTPTFEFAAVPATEPNPTFTCQVDGGAPFPCTTPFTTAALADGTHTFSVAATDFAGNTDATPATRTFRVDTSGPPPPPPPPPSRPQPGCPLTGTQIVGTNADNTLNGTAGVDIIFGLGGRDVLRGRGNRDCLYGGSGADRLNGGRGADRLFGNTGADRLTDSSGRDRFSGGAANDRINSRDASRAGRRVRDTVNCGSGRRDVAIVDRRDRVARNCERVRRRST